MGRGDQKSAKGKRARGSYGITRKRKSDLPAVVVTKKVKPAKAEAAPKAETAKKAAAPKKPAAPKKAATETKATTVKKPAAKKAEK